MGHDATQKKPPGRVRIAILSWCLIAGIPAIILLSETFLGRTPWRDVLVPLALAVGLGTLAAILILTGVVKPDTVIFRHRPLSPRLVPPVLFAVSILSLLAALYFGRFGLQVFAVFLLWGSAENALNAIWWMRRARRERAGLQPARNRKLEWAVRLAVALLVFGPYAGYRIYLRAAVNAELDAIRRDGYPATLDELDAWYPEPPRGQNAADIYMRAFAAYVEPPREVEGRLPFSSREEPLARGAEMPPEMRDAVEQHLAANTTTLELLHAAAAFRQCRYPVRLADGPVSSGEHLNGVSRSAYLLTYKAILCADGRQADEACATVLDLLALARSLEVEPDTMAFYRRCATLSVAIWGVEHMLSRTPVPEARLVELAAAFEEAENADGLVRALVGERCSLSWLLRDASLFVGQEPAGLPGKLAREGFRLWLDRPYLRQLRRMNQWLRLCHDAPLPARLRDAAKLKAEPDPALAAHPLGEFLLDFLPEIPSRLPVRDAEGTATLRGARCGLAVERCRLLTGVLPDALDQLVPDFLDGVPDDPFTGQPLRYKRLAAGYVVYSVGPDRTDDGGTEREPCREGPGDITFTVTR